jgi:metal-responsive CopG/Arc/MetJ family transcriptional regulator
MVPKDKTSKERDKTVNVPVPMMRRIDEIISKEELGFRTRTDFVRNAIRESIIKYNQILEDSNDEKGNGHVNDK